jgi:hypothetical protein
VVLYDEAAVDARISGQAASGGDHPAASKNADGGDDDDDEDDDEDDYDMPKSLLGKY